MTPPLYLLVVDDTPASREYLAKALERAGYEVEVAESGEHALELLSGPEPGLVILDVYMPGIDGFETCRRLKATERWKDVPVIFLTGSDDPAERLRSFEVGGVDFVPKPYLREEMLARVRTHLELRRLRQQAELRARELAEEIARRDAADRALAERNALLQSIIESTADVVFAVDPGFRYLAFNSRHAQVMKQLYGSDVALGRSLLEYLDPATAQQSRQRIGRALAGESFTEEWNSPGAPEHRTHFVIDRQPIRSTTGQVLGASVFAHDMTPRRRTEEALREREEQYRSLVESLEEVVFSLSPQGALLFVSGAVARYGFQPAEVLGKPFADYVAAEDLDTAQAGFARALAGEPVVVEARILDSKGEPRWTRCNLRPTAGGAGVNGLLTDLTALRSTEEQLRQSQKMEAIGRLASGIAHDFNNLLSLLLVYSELAMRGLREEDPLREDIRQILQTTERASALTRQLLAFSRRQVVQPEVLDLNRVVGEFEAMLRRVVGEEHVFACNLASGLHPVKADASQLEQVVLNLVVNARDAMPQGGRLTVETQNVRVDAAYSATHPGVAPGDYVELAVTDTGCGMDERTRARIFEPFFTTKPQGKGTGLGLPTVYGIVAQAGGHIDLTTAPGKGTCFRVRFPRAEGTPVTAPAPQAAATAQGTATVLLVEDDDAIRRLVARLLHASGFHVLSAGNGGEALLTCEAHTGTIDLLLTDVVMPRLNGRKLAERLAVLRPGLRVLYMSGYSDATLVIEPGMHFLPKPFSASQLLAKVHAALGSGGTR